MNIITKGTDLQDDTQVVIKRDGFAQTSAMPFMSALAWFHKQHSYSMDYALTHEGYTLHQEIFEIDAERYDGEPFETVTKFTERAVKMAFTKLTKSNDFKTTEWRRTTGPAIQW